MSLNFNKDLFTTQDGCVLNNDERAVLIHRSAGDSRRQFAISLEKQVVAKLKNKQRILELREAALTQVLSSRTVANFTFKSPVDFDAIHAAWSALAQDGANVSEVPALTTAALDSMAEKFKDEPTLTVQRAVEAVVHGLCRKVLDRKDAEFVSLQKDLETMRAKNNKLVGKVNLLENYNAAVRVECVELQEAKVQLLNARRELVDKRDRDNEVITKLNEMMATMAMREVASAEVKEVSMKITTETTPDGNRYLRVSTGTEGVTFLL